MQVCYAAVVNLLRSMLVKAVFSEWFQIHVSLFHVFTLGIFASQNTEPFAFRAHHMSVPESYKLFSVPVYNSPLIHTE